MQYKLKSDLTDKEREGLVEFSDLLAKMLYHRGVKNSEEADKFLNPNYDTDSHDPKLLKNIDKAVEIIHQYINENKKICIYSDYDADGIPGAVILADYFKKINFENFFNYIPHRNKEGFGLNDEAIKKIYKQKTDLIITIDCGITDFAPVDLANELGMKVIITDHHEVHDKTPNAFAIINPKQKECQYPEKNLCGSGVIFKLVQALISHDKKNITEGWEKWLLDMVGIATLSDMVPLVGENRVFAKYGLLVLKKSPRKGLQKLFKKGRINQSEINEDDIGFGLSPRINAASRMDKPELAFNMLYTDSDIEAEETVNFLDKINNERKGIVASMVKDLKKNLDDQSNTSIVVYGHVDWQPSLLGLVANSVVENFQKPVFLWGKGEGYNFKGSCRSDGSVNLVSMMQNVKDGIIYEFGGHEMAGGFSVHDRSICDLPFELEQAFDLVKDKDHKLKTIEIDHVLRIDDIDFDLHKQIEKMAPFGVGNEKPNFLFENIQIFKVEKFGATKNHLKIIFKQKNGKLINAIKFFSDDSRFAELKDGQYINLIGNIEKSNFGYIKEIRIKILDLSFDL